MLEEDKRSRIRKEGVCIIFDMVIIKNRDQMKCPVLKFFLIYPRNIIHLSHGATNSNDAKKFTFDYWLIKFDLTKTKYVCGFQVLAR